MPTFHSLLYLAFASFSVLVHGRQGVDATYQGPSKRHQSPDEIRGTVQALLDDFLNHLAVPHNLTTNDNPRRFQMTKDIFLNDVFDAISSPQQILSTGQTRAQDPKKQQFIENLVQQMTVPELALQMHLMFADNIIGFKSDNSGYDDAMQIAPTAGVGVIHDWQTYPFSYPTNKSQYNDMQTLNLDKSRLKIPMLHYGECVHGVGSFRQSMFPQAIGISASFDTSLAYSVGRAIGTEARSIGIHACLAPVLDLGKDSRWGRTQEAWGEDFVHTAVMGTAFASGLSKNSSWADPDAVVPVLKHFAAYGSPRSGLNGSPSMYRGLRELLQEMLVPFKAAIDLGGARGIMMSYNEFDEIPSHVNPVLYSALADWGFDGFVTADDGAIAQLAGAHGVASSAEDAIAQWFNAGGMVNFYDFPIDVWVNLLENRDNTLPLNPTSQNIRKIALIGPFSDILNYGDYSGQWGMYPTNRSSTVRQAMVEHLKSNFPSTHLVSSWGTDTWTYHGHIQETPNRDWGLYPPVGLPSNNFSAIWEGELQVPVDGAPDTAQPPPGGGQFRFVRGARHKLRLEFQAFNFVQKFANVNSLNAQIELFWNLVDRTDSVQKAVDVASTADIVVLAVGANWNSDGENGDSSYVGTLAVLADAIFALGKPVVLVLQGGRPFAIPNYYKQSAAVINAFFPGQSGGQAISDVLFGVFNPGGRVPLSVPFDVGTLPVYYNYKETAHFQNYTDEDIGSYPIYSFGYGLPHYTRSYTTFDHQNFNTQGKSTFSEGDIITFEVTVKNTGQIAGSYVAQVYLLRRVSTVTVPVKQLMAFTRVYLDAGGSQVAIMVLEVDRFLKVLNREYQWELQKGAYRFALLEDSGFLASTDTSVTLICV
ncbi:glycoside hydrolase family 3 protein [Mycena rebaudengoi]|nr:glycoside hydrolase family 3 protein [Mycena rebaudengoi]